MAEKPDRTPVIREDKKEKKRDINCDDKDDDNCDDKDDDNCEQERENKGKDVSKVERKDA